MSPKISSAGSAPLKLARPTAPPQCIAVPQLLPGADQCRAMDVHVVFSAECIPAFDWQSVGLFYSFNRTRQPGRITRLLACSEEQLATYPQANMDIGPTFVHRNMRFDTVNDVERGDPFNDDKAGHGCLLPPSNSRSQRHGLTRGLPPLRRRQLQQAILREGVA